jgi:hypothetical protein
MDDLVGFAITLTIVGANIVHHSNIQESTIE